MTDNKPIGWAISDRPIGYLDAIDAMRKRAALIRDGRAQELVWLLEHPPLYSGGTSARDEDLLAPARLPVFNTGRGGQYTYHGPGQRVAYLMLDMKRFDSDVRRLIGKLEAWIIATLAAFNVRGEIRDGRVGVWVRRRNLGRDREDKIAAIGLRITHGITMHGISLNVEPDLAHYDGIVPCGLSGFGVTSLTDLGLPVIYADVDVALRRCFEAEFGKVVSARTPLIVEPTG